MSIEFLNNYPVNFLEGNIVNKKDKTPLYGEIWVYQQFLEFEKNGFIKDEKWILKHTYNLSSHPSAQNKVEGEIDFLLLNKNGILIIEVKGGGITIENDIYYSISGNDRYVAENPFIQSRDYVHSLRSLISDSNVFVYRAVVFPHENRFELEGPQLKDYEHLFFSRQKLDSVETDFKKNQTFFDFINNIGKDARFKIVESNHPDWPKDRINKEAWKWHPSLSSKEIDRFKRLLFPDQKRTGYYPETIKKEIIQKENYETLVGLRRNQKIIIQGGPGTGKTVLARKFVADNFIKDQKGVFFCANKLIRSQLEYVFREERQILEDQVLFKTYFDKNQAESVLRNRQIDYVIFDEAQEYFDKDLFDFIEYIEKEYANPKIMVLYDPDQTVKMETEDDSFSYDDYFIQMGGFAHYYFDTMYRCYQNPEISNIANKIQNRNYSNLTESIIDLNDIRIFIRTILEFRQSVRFPNHDKIILIDSHLLDIFREEVNTSFFNLVEELTENNINISSQKVRYTTPIKYRGMENKSVLFITDELSDKTRVQSYIGITRAINELKIALWKGFN